MDSGPTSTIYIWQATYILPQNKYKGTVYFHKVLSTQG